MKDKEKQIEEMAKDCNYVAHLLRFNDPYMLSLKGWSELTKEMIKLGWIKPNENSVVLSKEEYKRLKGIRPSCNCETLIKQARKETAEKILERGKYCMPSGLKEWIIEQFGVEIKES